MKNINVKNQSNILWIWFTVLVVIIFSVFFYYKNTKISSNYSVKKDIAYSNVSPTNKIDIYTPNSTNTNTHPVVVWVHGGAFKMGSKSNPQSLDRLISEGFVVVSVDYRLSSEAVWPAQKDDMANIIKFLKNNAKDYGIDFDNIAIWGASAGGFLASISGTALYNEEDTKVKAVVDWFGPVDFYYMDEDIDKTGVSRATGNNGDSDSPESVLLGKTVKENKEASYKASPLYFIEQMSSSPKFLIMHGAKDQMIGAPQSERLYEALKNKFGTSTVEYLNLPEGTHGGGAFKEISAEDVVVDFLKRNLK